MLLIQHSEFGIRGRMGSMLRESIRRGRLGLRRFSRETLPQIDNYRHMFSKQAKPRPTLDELHEPTTEAKVLLQC